MSVRVFLKFKKRIIRVISSLGRHDSCTDLLKKFQSRHIFALLVFPIKNKNSFISNSDIHDINTNYKYNLHLLSTNLTLVWKGVLFSGSKIYNHLPFSVKMQSKDIEHFKPSLRAYLIEYVFYSIEEYYQITS
jgi:hypothetical protein